MGAYRAVPGWGCEHGEDGCCGPRAQFWLLNSRSGHPWHRVFTRHSQRWAYVALTVRHCASSCPASTCSTRHRVRLPRGALAAGQGRGEQPHATSRRRHEWVTWGRSRQDAAPDAEKPLERRDVPQVRVPSSPPAGEAVSKHREAPPLPPRAVDGSTLLAPKGAPCCRRK